MTTPWLQEYLVKAVESNLCTKVFCTTCGAIEFRTGVVDALALATGVDASGEMDESQALAIARAFREVRPADASSPRLLDAARCLLGDICASIGEAETAAELGESWAGTTLQRMQEHDRAQRERAAQRARAAFEASAESRRAEKKRLKQEQHEQRLALKKERDRLWRERKGD